MLLLAIAVAEVAFWVVLGAALLTRYVLDRRRASTVLLLGLPLVDLLLLGLVTVDLLRGADPTPSHGLAACYLGFTVAFGHRVVTWADSRVAHRLRGTPLPARPRRGTAEHVRSLWAEWARVVLAAAIAVAVLAALGAASGRGALPPDLDAAGTNPLWAQMLTLAVVTVVWFLAGPAFAARPARGGRDGRP